MSILVVNPSGTNMTVATLAAAVAAAGVKKQTVEFTSDQVLTANLTIPSNIELVPVNGAVISGAFTVSYTGSTTRWPSARVFTGTGLVTFAGGTVIDPRWFGAVGDGITDDTVAIQTAINNAQESWTSAWLSNKTRTLKLHGDFKVSSTLAITQNIVVDANCTFTAATSFTGTSIITLAKRVIFSGTMNFLGNGTIESAITGQDIGRSVFESLSFDNFEGFAFKANPTGNNNHVKVKAVGVRCGNTGTATFTKASDAGSGVTQRSTLNLAVPSSTVVVSDGTTNYYVTNWISATQVEVYPLAGDSGTMTYWSGGVISSGPHNDSNVWEVNVVATASNGVVLRMQNLYGHFIEKFAAEGCGIGVIFGSGPASPIINAVMMMPYFEGNDIDTLMVATDSYVTIIEPNDAGGDKYKSLAGAENGYTIIRQGGFLTPTIEHINRSANVTMTTDERRMLFTRTNAITGSSLTLSAPNKSGAGRLEVYLRGYAGATFTITPTAGFTIQGSASPFVVPAGLADNRKLEVMLVATDYRVVQYVIDSSLAYSTAVPVKLTWLLGVRVENNSGTIGQPKGWRVTTAGGAYSTTRANTTGYSLAAWVKWDSGTTVWECTTAGTSDGSAPSIVGKVVGDTVTDGTAVWTLRSLTTAVFTSEGNL